MHHGGRRGRGDADRERSAAAVAAGEGVDGEPGPGVVLGGGGRRLRPAGPGGPGAHHGADGEVAQLLLDGPAGRGAGAEQLVAA